MLSLKQWFRRRALAKQLRSDDPTEREAALKELGEIGSRSDVKRIAAALKDTNTIVRRAAARALRQIGDPRAVDSLTEQFTDTTVRAGAWQTEILVTLESFRDPKSLKTCLEGLRNPEPKVRRAAATALGSLRDASAIDPLLRTLNDSEEEVARAAAVSVAGFGSRVVPSLIQILRDGSVPARTCAAEALGLINDPSSIEPLKEALAYKDGFLQMSAAKALSRFNDPRVIEPLLRVLDETSPAAFFYGAREEAEAALARFGPENAEAFVAALERASGRGKLFAIKKLSEFADARWFDALLKHLEDPEEEIRTATVQALNAIDSDRTLKVLERAMDDSLSGTRETGARALMAAGWIPKGPADRARYSIALGRFQQALLEGEEGTRQLVRRLSDPEPAIRRQIAQALARSPHPKLLEALRNAAASERDPSIQETLIQTIEACGPACVEALVYVFENGNWHARRIVAQRLMNLGWQPETDGQRVLLALLNDQPDEAATAGPAAMSLVLSALEAGDASLHNTAVAAFRKLRNEDSGG